MTEYRQTAEQLFAGNSEMAMLMRSHDWSKTSLGAVENWSQSLKTAVRIMLTSSQAMFVWWGEELINLYNDAYRSVLGGKHPQALGQPAANVWREIWDEVGSRVEYAMLHNEGTYDEALLLIMERNGYPEETYYTFSYSPIPDDRGNPGGIICACTEETERAIAARQLALLRELAARTADARTFDSACTLSAKCLETNLYDLPFAMIYLVSRDRQSVVLAGTSGIDASHPAVPATVDLESDSIWSFAEVIQTQKPVLIEDLETKFSNLPMGAWDRVPHQAVVVAIAPSGSTGRSGILVAGLNPFRLFDDNYRSFIDLVAGQISASVANANAYEEERLRAEALAEIDRAKTLFFTNVSHEFRTPLTLMLSPLEELSNTLDERLQPDERKQLNLLQRNGLRLQKLVNTLLDFSCIEAGLFDAKGAVEAVAGVTRDITERKQIEEALRESEEQSRNILESITDGFFAVDQNWQFTYVNRQAERLLNRTPGDLLGTVLWEVYPGLIGTEFERAYRQAASEGVASSFTSFYPDHDRWYEVHAYPAPNGIAVYFRNVTERMQAEETLRRSEERYRTLFESIDEGFCVIEMLFDQNDQPIDYRFLEINPSFEQQTGFKQAEGKTVRQLVPNLEASWFEIYGKVVLTGEPIRFENRAEAMNRWFDVYAFCIGQPQERKLAILFNDISDRNRIEATLVEREARLRLIIESAKDYAIFTLDLQGQITSWNVGAQRLLDYEEAEILGQNGRIIFTPEDIALGKPEEEMQKALTEERGEDERWHVRKDGSRFWASGLMMPLREQDGSIRGLLKIMQDKTAQRQAEQEREQLLAREQAAREQAETANQIKDEFLAVLSHELRTPLNPILGWSNLLQRGNLDAAKITHALKTIDRNAKLQAQLIDDLLDISRILRGKLALTVAPVDLNAVICAALETVRLAAEAKSLHVKTDLDPSVGLVMGDAGRLQQVVWNLLSNAVKFTPSGGQIQVELTQVGTNAQIQVKDTGKGIDPDFLPYVFEHFRQEDGATTRKFGGLGLGLAIARQIVEMHGGTIHAQSAGENLGASFMVCLPCLNQNPQQPDSTPRESNDGSSNLNGLKLLVVDDDPDSLEFISFLLSEQGAKAIAVSSAQAALQVLEESEIDLIVSDIGMPELDGYTLMQQIRSKGNRIPAIALTAYAGDGDRQLALAAGYQNHLAKPVDTDALLEIVVNLIK